MCSIIYLQSGQMPPKEMLYNAVYNNWHSFGLVTKVDGKLDIKKEVPTSGEVDPAHVFELLQNDIEYERFLHLRHNTAGATNLENTHPFDVYFDPKSGRQIVFMHNGTMYPFVSKIIVNGVTKDDPDGPSDTKNFVDQILVPYIAGCDFGNGKGDIHAPAFVKLINKFWNGSNRGVLIANDQDALFIDDWKTVGPDGEKFKASNDQYFNSVSRGPEHTRRLIKEEEEKKQKTVNSTVELTALRDINANHKHGFFDLSESPCNILNDWDFYDRSTAVSVGYFTRDELSDMMNHKEDALTIVDWIFSDYSQLYEEYLTLEAKHNKASKMVGQEIEQNKKLKDEIRSLKRELKELKELKSQEKAPAKKTKKAA